MLENAEVTEKSKNLKKSQTPEGHRYCGTKDCSCTFSSHPRAKYWHPTLNGDKTPGDVAKSSNKKYWFSCDQCAHVFEQSPNCISDTKWCKYCSNAWRHCGAEKCNYCFNRSFASHPKSEYWNFNKNSLKPHQISKGSKKKFWFQCPDCSHDFEKILDSITGKKESWCPYCCHFARIFCKDVNCEKCYKRSFASSEYAKYLDPTRNGNINLREIAICSKRKLWFTCDVCKHSINQCPDAIKSGYWCKYCSHKWNHCKNFDCVFCKEKSFVSSKYFQYLHPTKNSGKPDIRLKIKHDTTKYWFTCPDCNHDLYKSLASISSGYWCKYCSVPNWEFCGNTSCSFCYHKSFGSHEKAKFWLLSKNKIEPIQVAPFSQDKYWFKCDMCDREILMRISDVSRGNWCRYCKHKTEKKLLKWLQMKYDKIEFQKKFEWSRNEKTKQFFKFDFYIPERKLIVSLDGEQHFKQVANWKPPKKTQANDLEKMKRALVNELSIVRIYQADVWEDKNNWEVELTKAIESKEKLTFVISSKVFVNNVYKEYGNQLQEFLE